MFHLVFFFLIFYSFISSIFLCLLIFLDFLCFCELDRTTTSKLRNDLVYGHHCVYCDGLAAGALIGMGWGSWGLPGPGNSTLVGWLELKRAWAGAVAELSAQRAP